MEGRGIAKSKRKSDSYKEKAVSGKVRRKHQPKKQCDCNDRRIVEEKSGVKTVGQVNKRQGEQRESRHAPVVL